VDDATLVFESQGRPSIPPVLVTGTDERLEEKQLSFTRNVLQRFCLPGRRLTRRQIINRCFIGKSTMMSTGTGSSASGGG
jgi:hypothetical protein